MLALAFLPTVSHALAAVRGQSMLEEVCTLQGARVLSPDGAVGDPKAPVSAAGHLEHCPFCALSAGAIGMPAALVSLAPRSLNWREKPERFFHAPSTPFAWRSAQPRAPPTIS